MSDENKGVHLFSNGSEFEYWESGNCSGCVKRDKCDLLDALFTDSIIHDDIPNGSVTPETAARLGVPTDHGHDLRWVCNERQDRRYAPPPEPEPAPAVREMRKAGASMLPGFDTVAERPAEGAKSWTA